MKYIRNTRTLYVRMVRRELKFYYVKDKLLDENNEHHQDWILYVDGQEIIFC